MITHQQRACMLVLEAEIERTGGVAPSLREIAKRLRRGKSQVQTLLNGLEERGLIRRLPGRARAIEILRPQSRFAYLRFDDETKQLRPHAYPQTKEASEG